MKTNLDSRQLDLANTEPDTAGLARKLASEPLKPRKPQLPADVGLFSDEAQYPQLDLIEMLMP